MCARWVSFSEATFGRNDGLTIYALESWRVAFVMLEKFEEAEGIAKVINDRCRSTNEVARGTSSVNAGR